MKIVVSASAWADLEKSRDFYESLQAGLGIRFLDSMQEDLVRLASMPLKHQTVGHFHLMQSRIFPFGIYYRVVDETIVVAAVLDLRRDPAWIARRLG